MACIIMAKLVQADVAAAVPTQTSWSPFDSVCVFSFSFFFLFERGIASRVAASVCAVLGTVPGQGQTEPPECRLWPI